MDSSTSGPLRAGEVIGARIEHVCYIDRHLPGDHDFQSRFVIVQLASGPAFDFNQSVSFEPSTGAALIYPRQNLDRAYIIFTPEQDRNLASPIAKVVSSETGWAYDFGLLLENGYVLTGGVSLWDEGYMFFHEDPKTGEPLTVLNLPNASPP